MFGNGFSLGSIFGIKINADFSWIFIFLLITWNLAVGVFPNIHPEWGTVLNWIVGITTSLLFFSSVLAHELAHSLVARARGLPVSQITLFIFGGVSNLEREPSSPKTEFLMAVVGPLTSIVLGVFFLFLGGLISNQFTNVFADPNTTLAGLGPVSTLLFWLGPINIWLGIFNLIPGFPLDGGRVLRSIIWTITGNLRKSTKYAAFLGQLTGWLFIGVGLLMVFGVNVPILGTGFGGIWLAFIGWFLSSIAQQSYQQVVIKDELKDTKVSNLMRDKYRSVSEKTPVKNLIYDYLLKKDERVFPVMKNSELIGLVSLEDIKDIDQENWNGKTVKDIMTPQSELEIVAPKDDLAFALEKITRKDVAQLPVIQDKKLVGVLDRRDIILWLQVHSLSR